MHTHATSEKTQASSFVNKGKPQPFFSPIVVQPKLTVAAADDPYEREADAMADKVMRKCAACEEEEKDIHRTASPSNSAPAIIQRKCAACEEEELQRKEAAPSAVSAIPSTVHQTLQSLGHSLDGGVQSFMEQRFGYDFSTVRIHDDPLANQSSTDINALAYTHGNHIVFGAGQYRLNTREGKHLLAHELTHVIQQKGDRVYRRRLSEEDKKQHLRSDRFKDNPRLQQAFNQSPTMQFGESSEGVKEIQRALRDLGYQLPISFRKTGDADGIFGSETRGVIKQFQHDNGIDEDGIVGRDTMQALDNKFLTAPTAQTCKLNYKSGNLSESDKTTFLNSNFTDAERPQAMKVLDDLCAVASPPLTFSTDQQLRADIVERMRIGQLMEQSQTSGGFAYPESSGGCPGFTGNSLADARVNLAAREYWNGPILETRAVIKNRHYYFELTEKGKQNAYNAMKLLFTRQDDICNKTLIHCDSLITLIKIIAYAESIGVKTFNDKVKGGALGIWLTYDGLSAVEGDKTPTAITTSFTSVTPANEDDLVIGDHVVFWNHQAYDAITTNFPGPWRLENAILVDKDPAGADLFEGHGAPTVGGAVKPGVKKDVHTELLNAYMPNVKNAIQITKRIDSGDASAPGELNAKYPMVFKSLDTKWYIKELDRNIQEGRPHQSYELREITDPLDPEIIGLRNPYDPSKMDSVERPVESQH